MRTGLLTPAQPAIGIEGLQFQPNFPNPQTTLVLGAGRAAINVGNFWVMAQISSNLSRTINQDWDGGGPGGRFPGAVFGANGTVHIFLMHSLQSGTVFGFDDNPTATNCPAGWYPRRIMSLPLDGSGNLIPFTQWGDRIHLTTAQTALNGSFATTANNLLTCPGLPGDISVLALGSIFSVGAAGLNIRTENSRIIHTNGIAGAGLGNGFEALSNISRQIPLWATTAATGSVIINGYTYDRLNV